MLKKPAQDAPEKKKKRLIERADERGKLVRARVGLLNAVQETNQK